MIRLCLGVCALALLVSQTACVSMSSLQTAETLEKGKKQTTFGGGTFNTNETSGATTLNTSLPYVEASYREGFGENFDAGLKVTIIGSYTADAKYRLIDTKSFDFSVGAGIGYLSYTTGSGTTETKTTAYDFMLPIYASYRFTDTFAAYVTPRYVYRMANTSGATTADANTTLAGGAAGVKIGKSWGVYLEGAYQKDTKSDFNMMQYNVALFWEEAGGIFSKMF